ncbi:hypothetical protein GY45DRAFT_1258349 [Cubamyces sp. BRFM 1775]|nr:hypothetical protein GY45DRAFT_1258349 [Cubamyces sp. BRFM 1775]
MKLRLAIAQYIRPGHPAGHEHWALVAFTPSNPESYVFQVVGNTDTFRYKPMANVKLLRSQKLCGGYEVGEVDEAQIQWLTAHLGTLPIVHNDPTWHCQAWVISAIRELQQFPDKVTIFPGFSAANARQHLAQERTLWESAESHFFETVFAASKPPSPKSA